MNMQQITTRLHEATQELTQQLQFDLFEKNYTSALQRVQKLISISPQSSSHHKTRSTILFILGRFLQCLQQCRVTISTGDNSIQSFNMAIRCCLQIDRTQLARGFIRQAVQSSEGLAQFFKLRQAVMKIEGDEQYRLAGDDEDILREMKQWLQPKGATYDKVKIVTQQKDYRGAIATKSIKVPLSFIRYPYIQPHQKDEVIVFIPKSQLLTLQLARQVPISRQILKEGCELLSPKHSLMAVLLLEERSLEGSRFKPYIDILPKNLQCFPINYITEELTQLIGSPFLFQIREKVIDLKKDYDAICYWSDQFRKRYTFKEYCWARIIVGSRVFGVVVDGVKTQVLAPFADMLNHRLPKQTVWNYSQQKHGFFIQSLKEISIGQQLFDSYGKKCNSRFLLNYGFVLDKNDRNQICIKIQFCEKDPTLFKKTQMLRVQNPSQLTKIFRITKFIQQNSFFQMMGYLRFKNIEKIQTLTILEKISNIKKTDEPYRPSRTPPTTMQVQLRIWAQLKNLCQSYLNDYATNLEQDQQILKTNNHNENMRNILILRMGQKRLYQYYEQMSSHALQILSKGYVQAREQSRKHLHKDQCRYIQKILNLMPHQKNMLLKKSFQDREPQLLNQNDNLKQTLEEDDEITRQY